MGGTVSDHDSTLAKILVSSKHLRIQSSQCNAYERHKLNEIACTVGLQYDHSSFSCYIQDFEAKVYCRTYIAG